jgi:para-aminobenzoate synthetase/4-amino-4-deoxychorismate lyase
VTLPADDAAAPWARFDDLVQGVARRFAPPAEVLVARTTTEVLRVLARVEAATADGAHAFGYLAYEAAPAFDPHLAVRGPDPDGPPLAWFGLGGPPEVVPVVEAGGPTGSYTAGGWRRGWTHDGYVAAVEAVRTAIAAGDTYQANLTVRLLGEAHGDLARLYSDLVLAQRGRYGAYLDLGSHVVASASPELFFEWSGRELVTRPMKGTAPRGRTTAEDDAAVAALLASGKERAENLMIVDLLRNDVARISTTGTVAVPHLCVPERFGTVWQLTSEVTGSLPDATTLTDVFTALFPSGSVTGAPKASTMRLLTGLEDSPRGIYCGAIGTVAPPDAPVRARFSVAIRTLTVTRATGAAVYGSGGGITWGSDPSLEHDELIAKTTILDSLGDTMDHDVELFETMALTEDGRLRDLDRHLARLADSARYLGFTFDDAAARESLTHATAGSAGARVRLTLDRAGRATVALQPLPATTTRPVRLHVDTEPVDSTSRWLFHKTTRREVYTDAAARHPRADDVVLVNERDEVTETTIANLLVRKGSTWSTPALTCGLLPGVGRARLLDDGDVVERVITVEELRAADELAVVSSLRGRRPAVLTDRGPGA